MKETGEWKAKERKRKKYIYIKIERESERKGERLAKETRADNVRVMVASGYFYIPDAPLKANVRDNASFPCTDRLHHPLPSPALSRSLLFLFSLPACLAFVHVSCTFSENALPRERILMAKANVFGPRLPAGRAYYGGEFAKHRETSGVYQCIWRLPKYSRVLT